MFIVGHLIGYGILMTETKLEVPMWVHLATWPALTLVLCLALLQPVKGAVVGLQYALGMHGFGGGPGEQTPTGQRRDGYRDLGEMDRLVSAETNPRLPSSALPTPRPSSSSTARVRARRSSWASATRG